jgi:hypothetical protein
VPWIASERAAHAAVQRPVKLSQSADEKPPARFRAGCGRRVSLPDERARDGPRVGAEQRRRRVVRHAPVPNDERDRCDHGAAGVVHGGRHLQRVHRDLPVAHREAAARVIMASGESGDHRRGWLRRLLADLLGTDSWIEAMPMIAQLDRGAFDALSAWLCHRLSSEADDGT